MTVQRYDLIYRFDGDRAEMIRRWPSDERSPGEWIRYTDHVESVCRMRDLLLAYASECLGCDGTGMVTIIDDSALPGRTDDCPECLDIREVLSA